MWEKSPRIFSKGFSLDHKSPNINSIGADGFSVKYFEFILEFLEMIVMVSFKSRAMFAVKSELTNHRPRKPVPPVIRILELLSAVKSDSEFSMISSRSELGKYANLLL